MPLSIPQVAVHIKDGEGIVASRKATNICTVLKWSLKVFFFYLKNII